MSCLHRIWPTLQCYFCKSEKPWKKYILADGCAVPICAVCYPMIETGKKLAQERGHYDPKRMGGDNMQIEKGNIGGNTLKVADVVEKKLTKLKITNEGEMKTYDAEKAGDKTTAKLVIGIFYEGQKDGDPINWSMNNKSRNALIDVWGDETSKWVGKEAEISISGEGEYKHIVVDVLRTK